MDATTSRVGAGGDKAVSPGAGLRRHVEASERKTAAAGITVLHNHSGHMKNGFGPAPPLQSLRLSKNAPVDNVTIAALAELQGISSLETFELSESLLTDDQLQATVAELAGKLKMLTVRNCPKLTPDGVAKAISSNKWPSLTTLFLSGFEYNPILQGALLGLSTLENLHLASSQGMTDEQLLALINTLSLKEVAIPGYVPSEATMAAAASKGVKIVLAPLERRGSVSSVATWAPTELSDDQTMYTEETPLEEQYPFLHDHLTTLRKPLRLDVVLKHRDFYASFVSDFYKEELGKRGLGFNADHTWENIEQQLSQWSPPPLSVFRDHCFAQRVAPDEEVTQTYIDHLTPAARRFQVLDALYFEGLAQLVLRILDPSEIPSMEESIVLELSQLQSALKDLRILGSAGDLGGLTFIGQKKTSEAEESLDSWRAAKVSYLLGLCERKRELILIKADTILPEVRGKKQRYEEILGDLSGGAPREAWAAAEALIEQEQQDAILAAFLKPLKQSDWFEKQFNERVPSTLRELHIALMSHTKMRRYLKELDLSGRAIRSLSYPLFRVGYEELIKVNLKGNVFRNLPPGFLTGSIAIQVIDLSGNQLAALSDEDLDAFTFFPSKPRIILTGNPLCDNAELVRAYKQTGLNLVFDGV